MSEHYRNFHCVHWSTSWEKNYQLYKSVRNKFNLSLILNCYFTTAIISYSRPDPPSIGEPERQSEAVQLRRQVESEEPFVSEGLDRVRHAVDALVSDDQISCDLELRLWPGHEDPDEVACFEMRGFLGRNSGDDGLVARKILGTHGDRHLNHTDVIVATELTEASARKTLEGVVGGRRPVKGRRGGAAGWSGSCAARSRGTSTTRRRSRMTTHPTGGGTVGYGAGRTGGAGRGASRSACTGEGGGTGTAGGVGKCTAHLWGNDRSAGRGSAGRTIMVRGAGGRHDGKVNAERENHTMPFVARNEFLCRSGSTFSFATTNRRAQVVASPRPSITSAGSLRNPRVECSDASTRAVVGHETQQSHLFMSQWNRIQKDRLVAT